MFQLRTINRLSSRTLAITQWRTLSTVPDPLVMVERTGRVAVVSLNRPKALNALCDDLIAQLNTQLNTLDADNDIGAIILRGNGRAFAAGADLKEMGARPDFPTVFRMDMLSSWENVSQIRTPVIAAVHGFALGGGCELAMLCDIIVAAEDAKFGQPEVIVGTIPGCGGTQRLIRAVGKSKAMEWILTGDQFTAAEAERAGLVSKVVPGEQLMEVAMGMAEKIAGKSKPVVQLAKMCVNAAAESTLSQGVAYEKRAFHSTWGLSDRQEGMNAFVEKRPAQYKHE